ncbi:Phosphotriesterase-related protein [Eumeta japonica]|uniref:Phosphotriesterase-related protein n=1 Tax=Eumeta variegata TaxID=151549 RepID=A0A4C1T3P6_EUMVA|nr:Phosphotriesterase-related protein [Eumeta japonica]
MPTRTLLRPFYFKLRGLNINPLAGPANAAQRGSGAADERRPRRANNFLDGLACSCIHEAGEGYLKNAKLGHRTVGLKGSSRSEEISCFFELYSNYGARFFKLTVLGPVKGEFGRTLTHEHLALNFTHFYRKPPQQLAKSIEQKISLSNLSYLRQYPYSSWDNLRFDDEEANGAVVTDVMAYKAFGGGENVFHSSLEQMHHRIIQLPLSAPNLNVEEPNTTLARVAQQLMKKVSTRWIPKMLTDEDEAVVTAVQELSDAHDEEFFQ